MLQLAVWGIAFVLVVKGLDVLHRQEVAKSRGEHGAPRLAQITALFAFVTAVGLAYLASNVRSVPELTGLIGYERHDEALEAAERFKAARGISASSTNVDTMALNITDADMANMTADARKER